MSGGLAVRDLLAKCRPKLVKRALALELAAAPPSAAAKLRKKLQLMEGFVASQAKPT